MTDKTVRTLGLFGMVVILFLGYVLRIQQLSQYPPGLSTDEASDAIDGLQISRHGIYPLYEDFGRPDPLYEIVIAAGVAVFGPSIFVIRLMNVWIGLITLACACWAARQCVPSPPASLPRVGQGRRMDALLPVRLLWGFKSPGITWTVGLTAAAVLAVSLGHITLSRAIYRGIIQPPCLLLFIGFVLRDVQTGRRRDYVIAGLSLGAAMYTYTAAFIAPLAVVALAISLMLFQGQTWRRWLPGLVTVGIVFVLVASLFIGRLLAQPQSILGRAGDVSQGAASDLGTRIDKLVGEFFSYGDPNPQYNTASAPLLPPLWGVIFVAGLGVLVIRFRQPSSAILVTLLIVETIPVLATEEVPHGLRIVGEYAVYPLIAALAVGFLVKAISYRSRDAWPGAKATGLNLESGGVSILDSAPVFRPGRKFWRVALLFGAGIILCALFFYDALWASQTYLAAWPSNAINHVYGQAIPSDRWFFRTDRQMLGQWIAAQPFPMLVPMEELNEATTRAWLMSRYPTVAASPDYQPGNWLPSGTRLVIPWRLETNDLERDTRQFAILGNGVIWLLPPLNEATHALLLKNIDSAAAINDVNGGLLGRFKTLDDGQQLVFEPRLTGGDLLPAPIFDGNVTLIGWHGVDTLPASTQNGQPVTLTYTLDWQPHSIVGHYYSAYLQLQTADEQRLSGDDVLIWRWLYPGSLWQPGDVIPDTHTLTIPANLSPGAYRLVAGLYVFPGQRIPAIDSHGNPLGSNVTVGWLKVPMPPMSVSGLANVEATFGDTFQLRGATNQQNGNTLTITLGWQSLVQRPSIDATIFVHVVDSSGKLVAQQDARPDNGQYPTFIWDKNEVVTTTYSVTLPPGSAPSQLHVQVGMYTYPSLARLSATQHGQALADNAVDLGTLSDWLQSISTF